MAYTETRETGYFDRLKSSCSGVIAGVVLIIIGTGVLWWNEGRSVHTADMLDDAQKITTELSDINKVDASQNGQLVHATGMCQTQDSLVDDFFHVGMVGIRIIRKAEYYQWDESSETKTEEKIGGKKVETTTYTYNKKWTDEPIQSSNFHDPAYQNANFVITNVEDAEFQAENVTLGVYTLNTSLINQINGREAWNIDLDDELMDDWNNEIARIKGNRSAIVDNLEETATAATDEQADTTAQEVAEATTPAIKKDRTYVHADGNVVYFGTSSLSPQVGDVRVTFERVMPTNVSILAKLNGDKFEAYTHDNGSSLCRLEVGTHGAEAMFNSARTENTLLTWGLRIFSVLFICGGFGLILGPISAVLNFLPFLAHIADKGIKFIGIAIGLAWSLVVFALAWLFYHPIIAICLLLLGVAIIGGGIFLAIKLFGKKK